MNCWIDVTKPQENCPQWRFFGNIECMICLKCLDKRNCPNCKAYINGKCEREAELIPEP